MQQGAVNFQYDDVSVKFRAVFSRHTLEESTSSFQCYLNIFFFFILKHCVLMNTTQFSSLSFPSLSWDSQ